MKVKEFKLEVIWEDGTVNDVSNYIPSYLSDSIDVFCEYWEAKHGDDENE